MDILTQDELKTIMTYQGDPCLSLYMPAHRSGVDVQQNSTRFKNLVRQAEKSLADRGLRAREVESLIKPAQKLADDGLFWRYQGEGFALFLAPDLFRHYRLPLSFEELVVVNTKFHVKPLLPLITVDGQFYVLAFSQNEVRLLRGTRQSVDALDPEGVPNSLAEALQYDDPEKQLQQHTIATGAGRGSALFHGHGTGTDDMRSNLLRYFQQIDRGLRDILKAGQSPLVLAGVDYLLPIYREANRYSHLVDEGIIGNPEEISDEELHRKAWAIVEPHFRRSETRALADFARFEGTPRASSLLDEILPAAAIGRVESLFVAVGIQIWGRFDPENGAIAVHAEEQPGDEDLLNTAAIQTFLNGGSVYALPSDRLPGPEPLAALYRY